MSNAYDLKPWTKVAVPHDDILHGDFDLSSYAANLGQVDQRSDTCPKVYKEPVPFYRATYRTAALDELLHGVASVVAGGAGNRVLQLRTPFGGGKTHTLIALLHLFRGRKTLDAEGLTGETPDPGPTRVGVLPCLDLDAADGRKAGGLHLRTLWGELAFRLGGAEAYEVVRAADEQRACPGGDRLRRLLDRGPTVVLLDEVLVYVEAALGIRVGDSTLGRQTMTFLQKLTEVVRGLRHGAVVYSLQQSVREAVGDEGLLDMLDSLVSRIDAKKEPVVEDDVLRVVQRRLFKELGDPQVREAVADEYGKLHAGYLRQTAQTEADRRVADDEGATLRRRVLDAYPFHPETLDLMYHRWGSLPTYQRTRGALQFLATVVGALWRRGEAAGPLIGPGDVLLDDPLVRNTFFSQVGEREAMKAVLSSDLLGTTARCRRVDASVAEESPAMEAFRPGTRLTRALALFSFGAKPGEDRGVVRQDLLAAVQMPGLTADVLDVTLDGLMDTLLYIHGTGRRYRFEKKPNLNKLVDEEAKKLKPKEVLDRIERQLVSLMGSKTGFVIWPKDSGAVPDRKPRFQVVFLGPKHILETAEESEKLARRWTEMWGNGKRRYRNALAFALPSASAMDSARSEARRLLAVENLVADRRRHGFDDEDVDDLEGREGRAKTGLVSAIRQMYATILLPAAAPKGTQDPLALRRFDIPAHQALGTGVLAGIYTVLENWLFDAATPKKLVGSVRLGDGEVGTRGHWIAGQELEAQFFGSLHFPKLKTLAGLKQTVARGVTRGGFGYVMGATQQDDTLSVFGPDSLTIGETVEAEDMDLSEGSYVISRAFAEALRQQWADEAKTAELPALPKPTEDEPPATTQTTTADEADGEKPPADRKSLRLQFRAKGPQLFKAFAALQVLSNWADERFLADVTIYARSSEPLNVNEYETSVVMALEEEGVDVRDS